MMKSGFFLLFTVLVLLLSANASNAIIADISPLMDNTIYEGTLASEPDTDFEDNTCGAGPNAISGVTGGQVTFIRRALLKFDIAGEIPAGSTINSVILTIDINRSGDNQDAPMTLHPLSLPWGEGIQDCSAVRGGGQGIQADIGDVTWLDAEYTITPWVDPGGDFGLASATAIIPTSSQGVWESATNPAMVTDVQMWLNNPTMNNGWIMVGDETRAGTTRRFSTREGRTPPVLTVDYTPVGDTLACCLAVPEGDCRVVLDNPPGTGEQACIDLGGTLSVGLEPICTPNPCPQPVGACCNFDESCSDDTDRASCEDNGGIFQGAGSMCSDNRVDCGLEPFVDLLPWPVPVVQPVSTKPDGTKVYEITMDAVSQQLHSELPDTDVWGYNNSYPGPTLETRVNEPIEVKYINQLPDVTHALEVDTCPHGPNYWRDSTRGVVHLHGGHVPSRFDGLPEYDLFPGEFDIYQYPNIQLPATLWYHDHALGITRLNVYMGMAAYYLLRDDFEDNLGLPPVEYEVPAVIQDRTFNDDGSFFYPPKTVNAFYGDKVLVNGKIWPYLNVDQGKYRFRFLNGSQARVYNLRLENVSDQAGPVPPMVLIGTDGGLIDEPIPLTTFEMAPAERFDVVIDFADLPASTEIVLKNDDQTQPLLPNVMKFIVQPQTGFTGAIPSQLRPVPNIRENQAAGTRRFRLQQVLEQCAGNEWLVQSLDDQGNVIGEHWDDIDVYPTLGTTEIWEFENPSSMMHPMHIHLVMFQVLDRCAIGTNDCTPLNPWEEQPNGSKTWKDTVQVPPGMVVRVIMNFESFQGKFPFHCHLLDHEDHEMMRQFQTTSGICDGDSQCEFGEDGISCADCGYPADPNAPQVSGAICGNQLCEIGDGEDFITCPQDCAGKSKGKTTFNCGSDDQNDPGFNCGFTNNGFTLRDPNFDDCITDGYFCRIAPRVIATCGDQLCEGQEQVQGNTPDTYCEVDCGTPQINCGDITNRDVCKATPDCVWEGGKNSGTCVDAAPAQCTYNDPSVTISPTAQDIITDGGSVLYTVSVTNNDTDACSSTTFNLSVTDSDTGVNFVVPSVLSTTSVSLIPGASQNVDLTVTGQPGTPDGEVNNTSVTASNPASNHANVPSNTVTTTINVGGQPVCSQYPDKNTCRDDLACRWDNKAGMCINR
jgi:spore coat protein A